MKNLKRCIIVLVSLFVFASGTSFASVTVGTGLFDRGKFSLSAYGGLGSAFNEDYFVLGLGAAYYIANGLALGVGGEAWTGSSPHIYKVTPEIRYVFIQAPTVKPYIGAFYRRTYYESYTDLDSYGGRAGIYSQIGSRGYAGLGFVYEKLMDCTESTYSDCTSTYPEISFSVGF